MRTTYGMSKRLNSDHLSQGTVYSKIMDEVLDQVAIAFEEDGVNHSVLDELKKVGRHIHSVSVALSCSHLLL